MDGDPLRVKIDEMENQKQLLVENETYCRKATSLLGEALFPRREFILGELASLFQEIRLTSLVTFNQKPFPRRPIWACMGPARAPPERWGPARALPERRNPPEKYFVKLS